VEVLPSKPRRRLDGIVSKLREGRSRLNLDALKPAPSRGPDIPEGARFLAATHSGPAGAREYRLYIPAALPEGGPRGLVVMLHGCKQNPEDFALGTTMNAQAEIHGLLVAYPRQTGSHNASNCWNWFRPGDQIAGRGEPGILAGMAREIATSHAVPQGRVFIAGLSAGGAMAAVAGSTHPETFAAIGVHSGLPAGAAHDVISAFAAMRGDAATPAAPLPRAIVFHGAADRTVHPRNGARVFEAAREGATPRTDSGPGWTRASTGTAEHWRIERLGHAWSGGDPRGSFTEASGPDASAEMVRFFLQEGDG
jgi:poly(hydroxyalkanoate) depolymerase family esterase